MTGSEGSLVEEYSGLIQELFQSTGSDETRPATTAILQVESMHPEKGKAAHFAALETAFRETFYNIISSASIGDPSFQRIWILLDTVTALSDSGHCDPALVFWLVEELLDSQTIDGCRRVFDHLESRRERMTAIDFKNKQLVILRACNELLRRLSRAEDTVFCGRVFIYLFQSFPLGDRSSVNLRGEYHVDNITAFDEFASNEPTTSTPMEVDTTNALDVSATNRETLESKSSEATEAEKEGAGRKEALSNQKPASNVAKAEGKEKEQFVDSDILYPVFWGLQAFFSHPTKLFEIKSLELFRSGLEMTLSKFKEQHRELDSRGYTKVVEESKRGIKRKREGSGNEAANSFNPKYLTSRDLFELEISDLSFRRHILVQALILLDFLLSLTTKAKTKLENESNKSVLYAFTLSEDDAKWASQMKFDIAAYLQQGSEGKFFYRMVDTVLSRDKNWVRWKAESCPPFQRPSVSTNEFRDARESAKRACTNKRIRPTPLGSLDLNFLTDGEVLGGLDRLKDPERYSIPSVESFKGPIAEDDFDLSMADTDEEKQRASNGRASKVWRILRVASKSKLGMFDKIDDGSSIEALFAAPGDTDGDAKEDASGEDTGQDVSETINSSSVEAPVAMSEPNILIMRETVVK